MNIERNDDGKLTLSEEYFKHIIECLKDKKINELNKKWRKFL